ncbi:MAG: long-chain fatty acid--CoA ligase [Nevskiaceae bacterium]|nr:MAG: long-chain fatty acid--CoA ligase [Nevskiaceae bacterium]TBR74284.1 MAG: long-chain fatty acid--CoA ligase [Nevskiaceae bacterium]
MASSPFDTRDVERDANGALRYTNPPASLAAMLRASVERAPHAEALVEVGGPRVTYGELWQRAARVAGGLRALGLKPGDRAAIRLPNGTAWVEAFFGCVLAGVVVVPVNTRFTDKEVQYVVDDSGARFVFTAGTALPDGAPFAAGELKPDDLAAVFYTSGTTGFPKGAMTAHRNLLSNCETVFRVLRIDRTVPTRTLVSVPLFHVTACDSQLLPTLMQGGTTVIMPAFDIKAFLRAIAAERIDNLITVPAIYWFAINQPEFADLDVSHVKWLSYGGAPIAPSLVRQLKLKFPNARVGNGFGLTETTSIATYLPHEYAAEHADSVGFPSPVMEVKLLDADPATGVGELLIRGGNVVSGYWNKPEKTAAAFVDGWLHTGDLARIGPNGLVYIVDRKKDMINRGGENVYCVEVENAIAAFPGVAEVAVIGVPDAMMGEKVGAVVVPLPGMALDAEALVAHCKSEIADFKVPQYLHVQAEPLPRNPSGKILKPKLRETVKWGRALR